MKKGKRTIKRIKNKLYANKASAKVLAQVRYLTGYEDPEVDYNRTIQRFVSEDKRADRKYMKKLKKDSLITEDEQRKAEEDAQKLTDKAIKDVDAICAAKEKEIMEV